VTEGFHFEPLTEAALRKAGWSRSRRVDTSASEEIYRQAGYQIFPKVLQVWANMEGLEIPPMRHPQATSSPSRLDIGAHPGDIGSDVASHLSRKVGRAMCPIGDWGGDWE
jgi:hypothetical protein